MSWLRKLREKVRDEVDDLLEDDDGILLDNSDRAFFRRVFGDISKASVAKQIAIGGVAGGCSGFLVKKVGKVAAVVIGGSLIIIQIANHQELITVNWGRIDRQVNRARRRLRRTDTNVERIINSLELFVRDNAFLTTSFLGGFLIGFAL